jgi:transposase
MVMKAYSPEFKADPVALYNSDPGLTIVQVARDLGVNAETLRNWIRADRAQHGGGRTTSTKEPGVPEATRDELETEIAALRKKNASLRKENTTLGVERDTLRKATEFCAAEMNW